MKQPDWTARDERLKSHTGLEILWLEVVGFGGCKYPSSAGLSIARVTGLDITWDQSIELKTGQR